MINNIFDKISQTEVQQLKSFFESSLVSQNQFLRILSKSFGLTLYDKEIPVKIAIGKFIMIFQLIDGIKLKELSAKKHEELIKRLMSDNGVETVNEIICHKGLSVFLGNYGIAPFFENEPDGYIQGENLLFPIEIKSRIPKLFEKMNDFYQSLSMLWPITTTMGLSVQMSIQKLDKKITKENLDSEIEYITSLNGNAEFEKIQSFPNSLEAGRKKEYIEYKLQISTRESAGTNILSLSQQQVDNTIFLTHTSRVIEKRLSPTTFFAVTLDDSVRQLLSEVLVKECLQNSKNIPPEPRGIVMYSDMLGDTYLTPFFQRVAENYIAVNKGTMVLGISSHFTERAHENRINLPLLAVGSNIKEFIKTYFFRPGAIK